MKAIEQYFPVLLTLYKVVLTFEFVDEILKCDHLNKIKATEQYYFVDVFIILREV